MNNKIETFWKDFIKRNPKYKNTPTPRAEHFCNNEKDANELAELVVKGIKQATCGALVISELENGELAKIGDLWIVTDFYGNPKCVTKTTNVFKVKYKDVTQEIAQKEGEGDKSLEYWQKVHWEYFTEEFKNYGLEPNLEMELIFDEFEAII